MKDSGLRLKGKKFNAVVQVFPSLDRGKFSFEQVAKKVKSVTGIDIMSGYCKHIFSPKNRDAFLATRVEEVPPYKPLDEEKVVYSPTAANVLDKLQFVAKAATEVGGIAELQILAESLSQLGVK